MALRAVEHTFTGATTPLFYSYGTVSVSTVNVTGTNTFFTSSMVGMKIGFGSNNINNINIWYPISGYTSSTSLTLSTSAGTLPIGTLYVITGYDSSETSLGSLIIQKSGPNPEDNYVGPLPVAIARPMEESTFAAMVFPHAITYSSTIDWVFLLENNALAAKKIFLYEYNKKLSTYNWKGFITATFTSTPTNRGFRALRYLHSTGTVSVAAPVSSLTGAVNANLAVIGTVTAASSVFLISHVGMMIGFGSTNPTQINCWYPIISYTSGTVITVSGASNIIANTTSWVIATCTVTGTGTKFTDDGIAAGTNVVGAAGGLGPRIGFGSTDPTQITQWFQIGFITPGSDTSLNLVTSPGVIAAGTPYVIEELRFVLTATNGANGGLFLVKGVGYLDFQTSTTAGPLVLPMIASAVDNQRGVYWLSDAGTTAGTNIVTNQAACGCAIQPEVNKGLHYCYVLDGFGATYMKVYRYNLRATGTITSGKMLMSIAYTTAGTVTASSGVVSGSGTAFTAAMVGMKIGFGYTSPALIATWYTIGSYTSGTSITLTDLTVNTGAGVPYIIDSADVIATGNELVAGAVVGVNNGRIGTLHHGPGAEVESLYFVTATRIYRAALSKIYAGNLDWISDNRPEIPPGSIQTFPVTGALNVIEIADQIDRLIVLTTGLAGIKQYITRYPNVAGDQFDRFFGLDDKQQDQSSADPNITIHFNTASQITSVWSENGIAHIIKHGNSAALCQMYALPFGAHWYYADSTNQIAISPSISTPDCISFKRLMVSVVDHLGAEEYRMPTASIIVYYRTNGIDDNSGSWTLIAGNGDLSGLSPSDHIQFMFEFVTISILCIPGRIMSLAVLYNDFSTEPHYQPSAGKTVSASKQFTWRFATAFGTTVPTLRVRLYDAVTDGLLLDDKTVSSVGTWEKSINDGVSWDIYDSDDKTNEITYIRYTPTTLPDNIKVRALLTLY
jgi:hypothetical protein